MTGTDNLVSDGKGEGIQWYGLIFKHVFKEGKISLANKHLLDKLNPFLPIHYYLGLDQYKIQKH
jgi:hypothetical protein